MWTPSSYREDDLEKLHDLMEEHSFALLVSSVDGRAFAMHLPFLLDRERGPHGTLIGHFARANPHWQSIAGEVLVVFQGPHAYISPSWYEDQATVPTWNYAVVHAYGEIVLFHEPERLRPIVERLTRVHEARVASPWRLGAALERELSAIVGFEIPIARLVGKFKLNQNRSVADRRGVVRALTRSTDPAERGVADLMARGLEGEEA